VPPPPLPELPELELEEEDDDDDELLELDELPEEEDELDELLPDVKVSVLTFPAGSIFRIVALPVSATKRLPFASTQRA